MPVVSAGRCSPVDQMGQAGPLNGTDQSVLSGSQSEYNGTDSIGPVGPYVMFDQVQRWAQVGRYPSVTLISRWLMDRWPRLSHLAQWARMGCIPCVIPISQWREGPFEVYDVPPTSGQAPLILNSLPGLESFPDK